MFVTPTFQSQPMIFLSKVTKIFIIKQTDVYTLFFLLIALTKNIIPVLDNSCFIITCNAFLLPRSPVLRGYKKLYPL